MRIISAGDLAVRPPHKYAPDICNHLCYHIIFYVTNKSINGTYKLGISVDFFFFFIDSHSRD